MGLIWFGLGAFLLGVALIIAGDVIRRREGLRRAGPADPFFPWFLKVVKSAFKILTDPNAGPGAKLAAAGTVIAAAGVVGLVVGMVVALGGNNSSGGTTTTTTSASA